MSALSIPVRSRTSDARAFSSAGGMLPGSRGSGVSVAAPGSRTANSPYHAGKALAVVSVVFLQAILLGGIGLALGWRPSPTGLALGAMIIALGTATFVAMGLLLGGTLRAEIVLAVANLLWFVFAGLGALTLETGIVERPCPGWPD